MIIKKFIDKDYKGIVLNIPEDIIKINSGLEEKLNYFKGILESLTFSGSHPDIVNSIYEIENYKDKLKEKKERERQDKINGDIRKLKERYYKDHKLFYIGYINGQSLGLEIDSTSINNKSVTYKEAFSISGMRKKWKEFFNNEDNVLKFLKENKDKVPYYGYLEQYKLGIIKDLRIIGTNIDKLVLKYKRKVINYFHHSYKNKNFFRIAFLKEHSENLYFRCGDREFSLYDFKDLRAVYSSGDISNTIIIDKRYYDEFIKELKDIKNNKGGIR